MQTHPRRIYGDWTYGCALDVHTVSSVLRDDGTFDTTRSEIGEALYQLKYHYNQSMIEPIAEVAANHIRSLKVYSYLNAIIPVPPSKLDRPFQPVIELARSIGKKAALAVPEDYLIKIKQTQPLKNIDDPQARHQEMEDAFEVVDQRFANSYLLVFDDLFRSGGTLNAVCRTLINQGKAWRVYTLTITTTRTKR